MQYFTNVGRWISGFFLLGKLRYKPGWNAWKFFPVYLLNYGTRVLTGGACSSWSRWFYENRGTFRPAKFMDRLLEKFDTNHGQDSSEALWDTKSLPLLVQGALSACFAGLFYLWLH